MTELLVDAYETIEDAADHVLELISKFVDVNTFFIARNDKREVNIVRAFNRDEVVLPTGFETLYGDSF
ncbi:hypothetical protein D3H55_14285 [Bacillus salacetis]|uniref:Uncharacterized protein n=1 Tax=Bacillus salacetis TaxID=2315464 RepID=A0A3A1QV33_9BACI|nr:hypothetical protein [Bacillus salacetis]RIW32039.1 hypothetical protein D3H55_14285 [Bacillus salacetis]